MSEYMSLEPTRRQVAIYGRVSDAETGLAIDGAVVQMTEMPEEFEDWLALHSLQYGSNWEAMRERPDRKITAVDGYFYFLDLPDGQYTLEASLPKAGTRYGTVDATATVSTDEEENINRVTADMNLPPTAIKGQVTNSDGDPVAMAKIQIEGSSESALSGGYGKYLLSNLEAPRFGLRARTVEVRVSAQGYKSMSQSIELFRGQVIADKNFKLEEERVHLCLEN